MRPASLIANSPSHCPPGLFSKMLSAQCSSWCRMTVCCFDMCTSGLAWSACTQSLKPSSHFAFVHLILLQASFATIISYPTAQLSLSHQPAQQHRAPFRPIETSIASIALPQPHRSVLTVQTGDVAALSYVDDSSAAGYVLQTSSVCLYQPSSNTNKYSWLSRYLSSRFRLPSLLSDLNRRSHHWLSSIAHRSAPSEYLPSIVSQRISCCWGPTGFVLDCSGCDVARVELRR
jgi:hypothetical protein